MAQTGGEAERVGFLLGVIVLPVSKVDGAAAGCCDDSAKATRCRCTVRLDRVLEQVALGLA